MDASIGQKERPRPASRDRTPQVERVIRSVYRLVETVSGEHDGAWVGEPRTVRVVGPLDRPNRAGNDRVTEDLKRESVLWLGRRLIDTMDVLDGTRFGSPR